MIPADVEERLALPMTADAAQAYADYVALGRDRSLRRLAEQYAAEPNGRQKVAQLKKWSSQYCWSRRVARPIVAEADAAITDNARAAMEVFRNCLAELQRRTAPARIGEMETRELVQVIDRVKPPEAQAVDQTRKRFRIVEFAEDGA